MKAIIDIIRENEERKAKQGICPSYTLYRDLLKEVEHEVNKELNELCKAGSIDVGPTLNDKYIKIK